MKRLGDMTRLRSKCPRCGSENVIPIVYGPAPIAGSAFEKALEKGEVRAGGCIFNDQMTAYCQNCEMRFRER